MSSRLSALIEEVELARERVVEAMQSMEKLLLVLNSKLDRLHRAKAYHTKAAQIMHNTCEDADFLLNVRGQIFHISKDFLLDQVDCYFSQMLLKVSLEHHRNYLIDRSNQGFDRILQSVSTQSIDFCGLNEYQVELLLDNIQYFHLSYGNYKWSYKQSTDVDLFQKYEITHIASFHETSLLISTGQGIVFIWNSRTNKISHTLHVHQWSVIQAIPYTETLICTCSTDSTVKLFDVTTNFCVKTFSKHLAVPSCITILSDGRICSGSFDRTIIIWNRKTSMIDKTLTGHLECIRSLLVLKDNRLASGSVDGTIKIWKTTSWKCEVTIAASSSIDAMIQIRDGRLCSALGNHTLRLWNIDTQSSVVLSDRHNERISCVIQLKDGRVCTGSFDTTIKVWNIITGECEMTQRGHGHVVRGVLQLQDGRICSVSEYESMKFWF